MFPGFRRTTFLLLAFLTLVLVPGCYELSIQGNTSVYHFASWLGPTVIILGLLGIPAGWLLSRWIAKWGYTMSVVCVVALIIVAPAMYCDEVVIDDDHFEAKYGFWFNPSKHDVTFGDLQEIRYVERVDNRNKTQIDLECVRQNGSVDRVHAGDLVIKAVPEILRRARQKGVPITEPKDWFR